MRLEASGLACVRGGREVFSGLEFAVGSGEALLVTGRNGAGKSSLLRMVAGLVRIAGGRLTLAGGDPEQDHRRAGPLSRPPGCAEAGPDGRGKPRVLGPLSRRRRRPAAGRTGGRRARRRWPTCRPPTCRPASGGGCRSPACWRSGGRSGCWTSRPRRSTARPRTTLAGLMRQHLAGGGLIVAAAHGPIGLDRAKRAAAGRCRMSALAALFVREFGWRCASAAAPASACCSF